MTDGASIATDDVGLKLIGAWSEASTSKFEAVPPWLVLDIEVRNRISRMRNLEDRQSAVMARAVTVLLAAKVLSLPPNEVRIRQKCPQCSGYDHGPPFLDGHRDFHISWSHTRRRVVAAASHRAVAIDTEESFEASSSLLRLTLTSEERHWLNWQFDHRAFSRLWSRKECAVKMGWIDLDRLLEVSFCSKGTLNECVRGMRVDERIVDGGAIVALTCAELLWVPAASLGI